MKTIHLLAPELSFLADVDRKIPLGSERKASVANYTTWQHGDLVFPFETTMTGRDASTFAEQYWGELWLSSAAYLAVIYLLRTIMESRPSFSLRVPLIMWNWALALFSMLGVLRMLPELAHVLFTYGTYHSVCVPSYAELNVVCSSWAWLFGMSKLVEYGDTIFIVLRKQPLIFLHWYHHITVMLYTWYSIAEMTASGRWFITLNLFVHSLMYSYYALRAMRVRVSKGVAMSITILQVLQMVVGIWVNISAYMHKAQGSPCSVSYDNIYASFAMYLSYFLLFLNFFYQSYISKTSRKWAQAQAAAAAKAKKVQ